MLDEDGDSKTVRLSGGRRDCLSAVSGIIELIEETRSHVGPTDLARRGGVACDGYIEQGRLASPRLSDNRDQLCV